MRITRVDEFDASVAHVQDAMVDPEFWGALHLDGVAPANVLAHDHDMVRVAMQWAGNLDGLGRTIAGTSKVTWAQTVRVDRARATGALEITTELRVKATCRASLRFLATGTDAAPRTRRELDGELKVGVPVLGGQAERQLAPGIQQRLDAEAAALRTWLTSR